MSNEDAYPKQQLVVIKNDGPPVATVGEITILVTPPHSSGVTVLVNPAVTGYDENPPAPAGIEVGSVFSAVSTDETSSFDIETGAGNAKSITVEPYHYTFTLLSVGTPPFAPGDSRCELLVEWSPSAVKLAGDLYNRGVTEAGRGEASIALATFEEVVQRHNGSENEELRWVVGRALHARAVAYRSASQWPEELRELARAEHEIAGGSHPATRLLLAQIRFARAYAFGRLGETAQQVAAYEGVIETFGEDPNLQVRFEAVRAMTNLGHAHMSQGQPAAAREVWQRLIDSYGGIGHPAYAQEAQKARAAIDALPA
jgi:hypothetical protein